MLLGYVESSPELRELNHRQRDAIAQQCALYLLRCAPLNESVRRASTVLAPDQLHLATTIRFKMSDIIRSYACNAQYKPAILRLAQGDSTGFRKLGVDPRRTRRLLERHEREIRAAVRKVQYPEIGPTHLAQVEKRVMQEVLPHAKWFASRKASFLTTAGWDRDKEDIVNDLQALGLVAARWYYPFRSGLHLANTVRQAITNRGQSIISYHTTKGRRRLQQLEDGSYVSMESHSATAERHSANVDTGSVDPREGLMSRQVLEELCNKIPGVAPVAEFVGSERMQDEFMSYVGKAYGVDLHNYDSLIAALEKRKVPYASAIAEFLSEPVDEVKFALEVLKRAVAA